MVTVRTAWMIAVVALAAAADEGNAELERLLAEGQAKYRARDYEASEAAYEQALALQPEHVEALVGRGLARYMRSDFAAAEADYTAALGHEPDHPRARHFRGLARLHAKRPRDAIEDFSAVLKRDPAHKAALLRRGDAKRELVNYGGAVEDYTRVLEIDARNSEAFYGRAQVHVAMGNFDGAIRDYTTVTELAPNWRPAYFGRARAYGWLGDHEAAERDFESAMFLDASSESYWRRARMRMVRGDYAGALADADKAVELDRDHSHPYYIRGLVQYNFGEYKKARLDFLKACKRAKYEPDYAQLYLCLVNLRIRRAERGLVELKEYVAGKKDPLDPWYGRIIAFLTGEIDEEAFLAAAKSAAPKVEAQQTCEAAFYAGTLRLIAGEKERARELFKKTLATRVRDYIEFESAALELKRLG